ncbi:MAG: uroporphyrinogen decarboxylase [Sandaracinaceae bacterium]|jgi:uroporphyrinogen decarboxylase|nr:uroporphyrinogen decarboxylase [Sandaracinaceae bacterium]
MSAFLKACRREPTSHTPIWIMRQAGRYQPEYRAIRSKVSFVELCKSPDLAAEVTILPVTQLGVDAAIIFADILLVLEPLGIGFEFTKDDGPSILRPIRESKDVDAVSSAIHAADSLHYVMESIKKTKAGLPKDIPLIGFAGAPFTLASYAIEGGGSKNYLHTKRMMYSDEGAWRALMQKLSAAIADYLNAQIQAGADAVQLFDSWVGALSPSDYVRYVAPFVRGIFDSLPKHIPAIHFGTGNPALYPHMKAAGGTVIGIDWRVDLGTTWRLLGDDVAIMGNLDPVSLLAPKAVLAERAKDVLDSANGQPGHIFNLGHGVFPEVQVDQVRALVDFVHEASAR